MSAKLLVLTLGIVGHPQRNRILYDSWRRLLTRGR